MTDKVYDHRGKGFTLLGVDSDQDYLVETSSGRQLTLIKDNCRVIKPDQTFPLSPNDVQLIQHRLGVNIDESSVQTINTGGYVMNDLYNTDTGAILCVHEYGVVLYGSMAEYEQESDDDLPHFGWSSPLFSVTELTRDES